MDYRRSLNSVCRTAQEKRVEDKGYFQTERQYGSFSV